MWQKQRKVTRNNNNNNNKRTIVKLEESILVENSNKEIVKKRVSIKLESNGQIAWMQQCVQINFNNIIIELLKLYPSYQPDNWWLISEAHDICQDHILISKGSNPCHSDKYSKYVIKPRDTETVLPTPIALVCEWIENGAKKSKVISIIKSCEGYWRTVGALIRKNHGDTNFSLPILGKENEANSRIQYILKNSRDPHNRNVIINKGISEYENLFATWSFVKVGINSKTTDNIKVPYTWANGTPAGYEVYLKEARSLRESGALAMSGDFNTGYIPNVVIDFVRGALPEQVNCISFRKSVYVGNNFFHSAYRLKFLTSHNSGIDLCKKYMATEFYQYGDERPKYDRCIGVVKR